MILIDAASASQIDPKILDEPLARYDRASRSAEKDEIAAQVEALVAPTVHRAGWGAGADGGG